MVFCILFGLGALATMSNSEAVLPAYMVGLALAGIFAHQRDTLRRLRTTVFAFLTPFYFLTAGMKVNAAALWSGLGLILILLVVKLVTKMIGVWPRGEWAFSLANMVGSVLAGCVAVVLGAVLAQGLVQPTWSRLMVMRQSTASAE